MTVITTGIFGLGAISYSITQETYISRIQSSRNVAALRVSILLDREMLLEPLETAINKCSVEEVTTCSELLELLIQIRNRTIDYKIFLVNSIGLKATDPRIKGLDVHAEKMNRIPRTVFGMSLSEASKARIQTAEEYFKSTYNTGSSRESSTLKKQEIGRNVNNLFKQSEKVLYQIDYKGGSTVNETEKLLIRWLGVIILAEIAIFAMVNISDLIINNSNPSSGKEFTISKIQPKVVPLTISIIFGLGLMMLGELMLMRQTYDELLGQCREHNQQSISFMNRIEAMAIKQSTLIEAGKLLELPRYCAPFTSRYPNILSRIPGSSIVTNKLVIENLKSGMIEYADSFQLAQQHRSKMNGLILQMMIALNVVSLLSLAIFLRFDSAELG